MVVKAQSQDCTLYRRMNLLVTGIEFLVRKMKKPHVKPIKLINPLNREEWVCLDYSKIRSVDGIDYIFVCKPENVARQFLMRKDALRKAGSFNEIY
jgi:hypothetical protein